MLCTLHVLLALCEGNPLVTSGFPSQRASNAELWYFRCCWPEKKTQLWFEMPCCYVMWSSVASPNVANWAEVNFDCDRVDRTQFVWRGFNGGFQCIITMILMMQLSNFTWHRDCGWKIHLRYPLGMNNELSWWGVTWHWLVEFHRVVAVADVLGPSGCQLCWLYWYPITISVFNTLFVWDQVKHLLIELFQYQGHLKRTYMFSGVQSVGIRQYGR